MPIPTHVFGFPARPIRPIKESIIAHHRFGTVEVSVLRWERCDFIIEGLDPSDGWFISFRISSPEGSQDLLQFRSSLFSPRHIPDLKRSSSKISQGDGIAAPKWHKADRFWPIIRGKKAEFIGQFYYDTTVSYLFAFRSNKDSTYIAGKDDISQQDAEEHYKDEENRA